MNKFVAGLILGIVLGVVGFIFWVFYYELRYGSSG